MPSDDNYDTLLLSAMKLLWVTEELHEVGQLAGEAARQRGDDRDQASANFQLAIPQPLPPGSQTGQLILQGFEERYGPLDDDEE